MRQKGMRGNNSRCTLQLCMTVLEKTFVQFTGGLSISMSLTAINITAQLRTLSYTSIQLNEGDKKPAIKKGLTYLIKKKSSKL